MRGTLFAATIVALIPLVLVIYYLLHKGLSLWFSSGFFTTDPTGSSSVTRVESAARSSARSRSSPSRR